MNASVSTMIVAPFGTSRRFALSAAGFIATSTSGRSPAVRMSWSAKWTWKPDTPGSEPAGARISAGKSGNVARSFPSIAVSLVNRSPVSCMPSPESPAKRMITASRCSTFLVLTSVSLAGGRDAPQRRTPKGAPTCPTPAPEANSASGVDLVGPAQEVPLPVVRRRALHRESASASPVRPRRRPRAPRRRRSASSAAGPSAYPFPIRRV